MTMLDTEVFKSLRKTSNQIWSCIKGWDWLAKDVIGRQWAKSTDSVGANLVEGDARGSDQDALRFFVIARASLDESRYWTMLAHDRDLISMDTHEQIDRDLMTASKMLDGLIAYRKRAIGNSKVHETISHYGIEDQEPWSLEPSSPLFSASEPTSL